MSTIMIRKIWFTKSLTDLSKRYPRRTDLQGRRLYLGKERGTMTLVKEKGEAMHLGGRIGLKGKSFGDNEMRIVQGKGCDFQELMR